MDRKDILATAEQLINGDRARDYGPPSVNFQRIADLWSPILGRPITAIEVGLCLTQLKVARLITTNDHTDSWIDLAGYAALTAEIATTQKETQK